MLRLLLHELRFRRNSMIIWGLALCFFPVVYVGLYPSIAEQMATFQEMMDLAIYQALGISMSSFESYMASTVTNLVPLILSIFALSNATGTLAGEEDDGRLELIIALPIPRWQIVTVKALALGISLLVILVIVASGGALTLMAIENQIETNVVPMDVFLSLLSAWPLVMAFGIISMFLGAVTPSRRIASMIATFLVILSYLGNNLTGLITELEPLKNIFLFNFYDASADVFKNGQQFGDVLVLSGVILAAYGLTLVFFGRRDITVGMWPWQRGRLPSR